MCVVSTLCQPQTRFIFSHILKPFSQPILFLFFFVYAEYDLRLQVDEIISSWLFVWFFLFVGQAAACSSDGFLFLFCIYFLLSVSYAIQNAIDTDLVMKTKTQSDWLVDVKLMKMRERKLNCFSPVFAICWKSVSNFNVSKNIKRRAFCTLPVI